MVKSEKTCGVSLVLWTKDDPRIRQILRTFARLIEGEECKVMWCANSLIEGEKKF